MIPKRSSEQTPQNERFWNHFGEIWAPILNQKALKIGSERHQKLDVILGTFFFLYGKRPGGMRGPVLCAFKGT